MKRSVVHSSRRRNRITFTETSRGGDSVAIILSLITAVLLTPLAGLLTGGLQAADDVPYLRYADSEVVGVIQRALHSSACMIDFNGDGAPDLAVANRIDDTVTVSVAGEVAAPDRVIRVATDADSQAERVAVDLGDRVVLRVTSDVADRIHVHGYDVYGEAMPGMAMDVTFVADIPGVFEVELEESSRQILTLEVG